MLLISRHGKTRLNKYYKPFNQKERTTIQKEVSHSSVHFITPLICEIYLMHRF